MRGDGITFGRGVPEGKGWRFRVNAIPHIVIADAKTGRQLDTVPGRELIGAHQAGRMAAHVTEKALKYLKGAEPEATPSAGR